MCVCVCTYVHAHILYNIRYTCLSPSIELVQIFFPSHPWASRFVAGFLMLGTAGLLTFLDRRKRIAEKVTAVRWKKDGYKVEKDEVNVSTFFAWGRIYHR